MKTDQNYKIVNKSKDGVIIIMAGKKITLSWDKFNNEFVMNEDKRSCRFNDASKEKIEKMGELVKKGTVAILTADILPDGPEKLIQLGVLGKVSEDLKNLLGISDAEVLGILQQSVQFHKQSLQREATRWNRKQQSRKDRKENEFGPELKATTKLGDLPQFKDLMSKIEKDEKK